MQLARSQVALSRPHILYAITDRTGVGAVYLLLYPVIIIIIKDKTGRQTDRRFIREEIYTCLFISDIYNSSSSSSSNNTCPYCVRRGDSDAGRAPIVQWYRINIYRARAQHQGHQHPFLFSSPWKLLVLSFPFFFLIFTTLVDYRLKSTIASHRIALLIIIIIPYISIRRYIDKERKNSRTITTIMLQALNLVVCYCWELASKQSKHLPTDQIA